MQSVLPSVGMTRPTAHAMQVLCAGAPAVALYLPVPQSVQSLAAPLSSVEYLPAAQFMQSDACALPAAVV